MLEAMASLLAAMVVLGALCIAQERGASISGKLVDSSDAVIPNAKVTISGATSREALTDNLGDFLISGLGPGTYKLRFESPGFKRMDLTVAVQAGKELSLGHLKLNVAPVGGCVDPPPKITIVRERINSKDGAIISGVVRGGNQLVANATITLTLLPKDESHKAAETVTDAGGFFKIQNLDDGVYNLEIQAPGFGNTIVEVLRLWKGQHVKLNPVQLAPFVLCL